MSSPLLLGVNIDHVATLRQARYAKAERGLTPEPDVLRAAEFCEHAGASGITAHLRADRRHIQDADIVQLRARLTTKLNLEMGNTPEILEIALRVQPADVCLVPENRQEITTEGGLDAAGQRVALEPTVAQLRATGIRVSLFIEPAIAQIEAALELKAEVIELHTGAFANAEGAERVAELERLIAAAEFAHAHGLIVNAGHGIHYENLAEILRVPHLHELNIGHAIISRAIFIGLEQAVRDMLAPMQNYAR